MKKIYPILSLIFHPIWIPTWVLLVWFHEFLSDRIGFISSTFGAFLGYELAFIALIPGLVALSTRMGKKTDWEMEEVRSRIWPFLIGGIFWLGYTLNLGRELGKMSDFIWLTTGSGGILLITLSFCYYKGFKVSAHSSGWALLIPILLFNQNLSADLKLIALLSTLTICGFVTSIRWISGAHQFHELMVGIILGFMISFTFIQTISFL